MATLDQFATRMRELGRRVDINSSRLARQTALVVDQAVVVGTPVDTGTARSNWQLNLGEPVEDPIAAYVPGIDRSTEQENTQAAIAQAQIAVSRFEGDGEIWISNPITYITPLNEGTSDQAPAGFVEEAVQTGRAFIRRRSVLGG